MVRINGNEISQVNRSGQRGCKEAYRIVAIDLEVEQRQQRTERLHSQNYDGNDALRARSARNPLKQKAQSEDQGSR